jgi:tetratricopeptide (TPR) repeat protein
LGKLWDKAQDLLQIGDNVEAVRALCQVQYYYPEDAKGESALWQAANLQKELALTAKSADWDKVLDLFRRYKDYYPKSPRAAEAYFEIAKTYQAMRYYREAQSYFKLFMKRYPESPLVLQAMRWYRNSLLRVGHGGEAEKVFTAWQQSPDVTVRMMGEAGAGNLKSIAGDYQGALAIYQKILSELPTFPVADPEILFYAGIANMRLGKLEVGREQLYHYLTLAGMVAERTDVLLELAESYFAAGEYQAAHKLYRQLISEEGGDERAVLVSTMRVSQYLDDPDIVLASWQRHNDLKDREGDKPYLAVLEKYRDPIAQDARFGVFRRYQARGELDKAYEVGRNFLRSAVPAAEGKAPSKEVTQILLYLVEALLKEKKYQQIYDLYAGEYRHIKELPSAKFQSMMGQALEALNFYKPAAVFYYLALQWPMTDQEKTDLYFRRAEVYLAAKDYEALDRLLTHLRTIYQKKPEAGEVAKYSAKLSAARGQIDKAHDYYEETLRQPASPEKRTQSSVEALGLMLQEGKLDTAETILVEGVAGGWIAPEAQQGWWLSLGNGWRLKKGFDKALAAYTKGLAQGLPDKGEVAQQIHLYLGDVLFALGDQKQGLSHYQAAVSGDNPLWKKMASERVAQHELDTEMATMQKGSAK